MKPGPVAADWSNYAFVALGSNLGASDDLFSKVLLKLQELADGVLLRSAWWKSSPVDCPPDSPEFLNGMVAFKPRSSLTAESLLERLQALEREFGRVQKKTLNEPRPLDLDLISFNNQIRNDAHLTLPHPRAHLRRFVLQPLAEIAPDFVLPGFTESADVILRGLRTDERLMKLGD